MKLTIIRDDGVVGVDGVFRNVNLSSLPQGVRAVQWDGTSGHVEYDAAANTALSSISSYQSYVDAWTAAAPAPVVPPAQTVPTVITMRQARLALLQGGYLTQVDALIAAMTGSDGDAARITWQFAATVERAHPLVSAIATELSLTSTQVDNLFTLGSSL
jgi:hypothetical protein